MNWSKFNTLFYYTLYKFLFVFQFKDYKLNYQPQLLNLPQPKVNSVVRIFVANLRFRLQICLDHLMEAQKIRC